MSSGGFHVHGPHDHELEHAAHHEPKSLAGQLAVITAILATVGAFFAYMGGATQANAGLLKNEAAIRKTEAANQWAYYQSKSSKQNLAELALDLTASEEQKAKYRDKIARYEKEKADIKVKAEELEAASKHADDESAEQIHLHHRWAQATTALQVSIALAAIALLTKKKWMEGATLVAGVIGVALGGMAWLHF
jgi:ABC-type multidrug transport system fused ATPase/permease subunit